MKYFLPFLLFVQSWGIVRTHQDLINLAGRKGDITHLYDLYNRAGWVTPQEFGAIATDTLNDTPAIQAAATAVGAAGGGIIFFPAGTYYFAETDFPNQAAVLLESSTTIVGEGESTVFTSHFSGGNEAYFFYANSKNNIHIRHVAVTEGNLLRTTLGDNHTVSDCYLNGWHTLNSTQCVYAVRFGGTSNVALRNCKVIDYYNGIYLIPSGGAVPEGVEISGCHFEHVNRPGANQSFPTGVYLTDGKRVAVTSNRFVNILVNPADTTPGRQGYGFYEGDGNNVEDLLVSGNEFLATDTSNATMTGILCGISQGTILSGNLIRQAGQTVYAVIVGGSGNIVQPRLSVVNNTIYGGSIYITATSMVTDLGFTHVVDNRIYSPYGWGIRVDGGSHVEVSRNTILKPTRAGIHINSARRADVSWNHVEDPNTQDSTFAGDDLGSSGISLAGVGWARVIGNRIENRTDTGNGLHGIDFTSSSAKLVYRDNDIAKMKTAPIRAGYTAAPTLGYWYVGERGYHMSPTALGTTEWVCTNSEDDTVRIAAAAGATTLEVGSTAGMTTDRIGVVLDDGDVHWTGVATVVDGNTLTLSAGIPASRSAPVGALVHNFQMTAYPW